MKDQTQTFRIVTLGCRSNQYESQAYCDQLKVLGWRMATEGEPADLCIVNSCTVTASADKRSFQAIQQLRRDNPTAQIVATGCFVEGQKEKIQEIPGVFVVVSNCEKESLIATLFPDTEDLPEFSIRHFDAHTRAFVKIQDGCNSFCSYCIIPYVRGRSRSRSMYKILSEVEQLVKNGYQEVVLTGINVGDFKGSNGETLADVVRAIDEIKGIQRVRVSSIDPDDIDDDLRGVILSGVHTCPSMHIVLQSGSDTILKKMNRKYNRQLFLDAVNQLKEACPDFTFTTDVIVGFPGETEADFQETLKVIEQVQFAKVHLFPYSDRPRTRATTVYQDKIPPSEIHRRKQEALRAAEAAAYQLRQRFVGHRMKILTETNNMGHSENFLPVKLIEENIAPNQLIDVDIIDNTQEVLIGKCISK